MKTEDVWAKVGSGFLVLPAGWGAAKRPDLNPGRPGWIKACASSPGPAPNAGGQSPGPRGTPAPGDRVRDQEECLDEGAGSQESVPARWSYSCELSEAPPASPGLQIGEPAPGGLASERTRGRARARARAPRDRAGGGEAAAASQRNGSEASDQL